MYSETVRQQKESAASIGNGLTQGELQNALKETQIARDPQHAEKIAEKVMNQVKQESKVRTDKIAVIQQRVESGFYNSPEVFEKIAEELMKEMKF
ncbi:MAG: hypothetical protein D6814_07605 [Calditrichaeota bacterium]|nr:MAG: hypothetical protein D6814_07605 [Calditrichota bacterium]